MFRKNLHQMIWLIALFVVGVGVWQTQIRQADKWVAFSRDPEGIMGTTCRLVVVMDYRQGERAEQILDAVEARIRNLEALASNWVEDSEISRFNTMPAGEFAFSNANWEILQAGRAAYDATGGAFDLTCRPLIELWADAGRSGMLPSDEAIAKAREESDWRWIEFLENGKIRKTKSTVRLDLGGIAKGYAIDRAIQLMQGFEAKGGMVDIGGDVRVFGASDRKDRVWPVGIRTPNEETVAFRFQLPPGMAACTSGHYARYVVVENRRFSHILDPRTGYPTDHVPSVTVVAASALDADIWSTALSVIGPDGLLLLPEGIEASLIIMGEDGTFKLVNSDGFPPFM